VTEEDIVLLEIKQAHRCTICGREGELVLDHCDATGKIRGMLCRKHNTLLGMASDNYRILA
jgi:hypothetical protein